MILVDTHVLIWLDGKDPKLGPEARKIADDALTGTICIAILPTA